MALIVVSLLDPFTRVVFMNQSQATEKVDKTLCPTWDQTLIFESVDIYSDPRVLADNPPEIVIEVFDHDAFVCCFGVCNVLWNLYNASYTTLVLVYGTGCNALIVDEE